MIKSSLSRCSVFCFFSPPCICILCTKSNQSQVSSSDYIAGFGHRRMRLRYYGSFLSCSTLLRFYFVWGVARRSIDYCLRDIVLSFELLNVNPDALFGCIAAIYTGHSLYRGAVWVWCTVVNAYVTSIKPKNESISSLSHYRALLRLSRGLHDR